jgi:hypothetical protein
MPQLPENYGAGFMVDWVNPVAIVTLLVTSAVFFGLWLWSIKSPHATMVVWAARFGVLTS